MQNSETPSLFFLMKSAEIIDRIRSLIVLPEGVVDIKAIPGYLTKNPKLVPNLNSYVSHRFTNTIHAETYPSPDTSKRKVLALVRDQLVDVFVDGDTVLTYGQCNQDNQTIYRVFSLFVSLSAKGDELFTYAYQTLDLEDKYIQCSVTDNPVADVGGLQMYCDRILCASDPFALHVLVTGSLSTPVEVLNSIALCTKGNWLPCNIEGAESIELPDFDHDPYLESAIYLLETVITYSDSQNSRFMAALFQYILAKEQDKFINEPTQIVSLSDGLVGQLLILGSKLRPNELRNPYDEIYVTEILKKAKELGHAAILVVRDDCEIHVGKQM
jgi:hypothetical protein